MLVARSWLALLPFVAMGLGCGAESPGETPPARSVDRSAAIPAGASDADQVRRADYSILFVGNSHTVMHDLPGLVCDLIRFRHPGKTTYSHLIPVVFLEDVATNPRYREELETRSWKFVVLQAQKISVSGKHEYSRTEAIEFAKLGKARGADVVFYPEWGLKGVAGDGPRQEKVYREMAAEAGVSVAPVGRAWDLALARRPDLGLHDRDGNHQTAVGAFLTACVLYGQLTGETPVPLASFPSTGVADDERKFLAGVAAEVLKGRSGPD